MAIMSSDKLSFVESENGDRVGEGKLMQRLENWQKRGREHDHFGVIDSAENFLKLSGRGKKSEVGI